MVFNDGASMGSASGVAAVEALTDVLREKEKTRRLLIGAACFFLCVAALIVMFSPAGKETMSYILGASLLIVALGAIGVAKFKISAPGIAVSGEGGAAAASTIASQQAPFQGETPR